MDLFLQRRHLILLAPLTLLMSLSVAAPSSSAAPAQQPTANKTLVGTVDRVLSGDRIRVKKGKRKYTVTLAGIDAPRGSECFASESRDALEALASPGSTVRISTVSRKKRRVTGYVVSGSSDVNAAMVAGGYAESTGKDAGLDSLESEAAQAGNGLHGACSEAGSGNTGSGNTGSGNTGSAAEYTAAQKQEIITRYSQNLVGLEVSFSTGNGSVTDTYGISFCSPTVYSLFQISSFSGSGSTSSQHAGSWRITEAGGVPGQSEIVRIAYTPGEVGRDPFFTDLGQLAGGAVIVNNRQAGLTRSSRC